MIQFDQWWFPDGETQLPQEMAKHNVRVDGRLTWQYHKYAAALALCPPDRRRVAIDVGAHVGLWSCWMARDFAELHAFEPNIEAVKCWIRNLPAGGDVTMHTCALGERQRLIALAQERGQSGGAHVNVMVDDGVIPLDTLDSYQFAPVDLIKIDVEGYEAAVLAGARETLLRCQPIVIVESIPEIAARYGHDESAAAQLSALGMTIRTRLGPDAIWEWA